MSRNISWLVLIFILSIECVVSQKIKEIKIEEKIKGRLEIDESHKYFKLELPKDIEGKILQIITKEDKDEEIDSDEPFSDPDIYVSKINKYPSSPRSSEWYSERYGDDVLTIPTEALIPGDTLYLGIYCQFKCRYNLYIKQSEEAVMEIGKYNLISLGPHQTLNYKLKIKDEFDELNIISFSETGKFKIYVNKEAPSSQNTINVIPSWKNGYVFQIKKSNKKEYCSNCHYHIAIHNEKSETIYPLTLYAYFPDKIIKLKPEEIMYDAMEQISDRCYSFAIAKEEKKERLIIQTTMFSGGLSLVIDGWTNLGREANVAMKQENYTYTLSSEQFILLEKHDFAYFDSMEPKYEGKDSTLHFCLYSKRESSFSINVYFLSKVETIQSQTKANILSPSVKLRTYLLKDQMMKYELTGFNLEKKDVETNITVTTTDVVGSTKLYGYFCKNEKCLINKQVIEDLKEKDKLLIGEEKNHEENELTIPYEDNKCLKKPKITLSNNNTIDCVPIIGVLCETPNDKGLCVFDIKLTISDIPLLMTPKQMYYGSIPLGKTDFYEIIITDENVHSLVVVLNSESGDAELTLFREKDKGKGIKEGALVSYSWHNDYIPDVVRITPKYIGRENLVGRYIATISATCYSNYNLYYYVIYNKDKTKNKTKLPEVTMNIEVGQIITDYFPNDIRYKIYSFTPLPEKASNLKIFLDRVNVDFTIYVYSDISKFKILQMYDIERNKDQEPISGYDWKSEGTNEINILKSDPKYKPDIMYYIIIAPNLPKEPDLLKQIIDFFKRLPTQWDQKEVMDKKAPIKFYLGVTEVNEPITISEGIPHTLTLNKKYTGQYYYYEHYDFENEFTLEINVLYGEIDIFIDVEEINLADIKQLDFNDSDIELKSNGSMLYMTDIRDEYESITINSAYLKKYKNEDNDGIKLYFYIRRSESSVDDDVECKYSITQKSSEEKGQLLQPGLIKNSKLLKGEKHFYIIEEVRKRKGGSVIKVNFDGGSGDIYVKIPNVPEAKNIRFPGIDNYDYKGELVYSGKIVKIPEEVYERLDSKTLVLQILVTVEAKSGSMEETEQKEELYYSISYSNEPKMISQNTVYDGYITRGEMQYYTFYFDENVNNIYFGLYNMNGDVDMYVNYGSSLPTLMANDWSTKELCHEYIDINKEDPFFQKNNFDSVSGTYTLLLEGFTDSAFSLFVSSHDQKVLPLRNNKPVSCHCMTKGDKCYLRYNEVFDKENKEKGILNNNIVFTTQYLYGNGIMYAKLFKDSEIHGEEFYKHFPSETEYDISNIESNQRNYMKMKIEESKYEEDTAILMTFICDEKTHVDISSTILRHYPSEEYIQENKENVFYVGGGSENELKLYFNNLFFEKNDFVFNIHAYVGDAHIKLYSNDSRWDTNSQKEVFDYTLYKEFDVLSSNENSKDNIEVYNPFTKDYHGFITPEQFKYHQNFVFQVIPKSDFGFYIQCNYEKEWNEILIGSSKTFYARRNNFYGYFDITNDYTDVEIALSIENNILLAADLYVKINIVDTTQKWKQKEGTKGNEMSLYKYILPTPENYDFFQTSDEVMGTIALNLNHLPKIKPEEKDTKFVRVLLYARLRDETFRPLKPMEGFEGRPHRPPWAQHEEDLAEISILVTPGVERVKYVDTNPNEYYYSKLLYGNDMDRKEEAKIYTLQVENKDDDILTIEISSCFGDYEYSITDSLEKAGEPKSSKDLHIIEENRYGKKIIIVNNIKSKIYYLTVFSKMNDIICKLKYQNLYFRNALLKKKKMNETLPRECGNNLSYLLYYHSSKKSREYFTMGIKRLLIHAPYGNGKIKILVPPIIKKDILNNNQTIEDYKFDVFATTNEEYYKNMDSICFLNQYKNFTEDTIFKIKDVKHEGSNALIISGLGYRKRYFINVLAQSTKSKELIAFQPFEMWTGGYLPLPIWKTSLSTIIIIVLIVLLVIFIKKYFGAKQELKEIKGETLPKTEAEISSGINSDAVIYSGLRSSY